MGRRVLIGAGLALVVLVAAGGVGYWLLRPRATPVSVGAAVRRYRHAHAGAGGARGTPPPGVYAYTTRGFEELSVPGTHRAYPTSTTITLTPGGCGVDVRWDALVEHVEELQLCTGPDGSVAVASARTDETFLNVATQQVATCDPAAWLRPPNAAAGQQWRFGCRSARTTWSADGTVMGLDTVRVDGRSLSALHVRVTMRISGQQNGTTTTDYWFAPNDSLLLAWAGTVDVSQGSSPLGSVQYHEQYRMDLLHAAPQR